MQLTYYTDYGLRILMYLCALPAGKTANIDQVSEVFGLSRNHVNKIVHQLGREGFIATQRGKGGGIRLGMKPEEIRLGDLVRRLETTMQAVDCEAPSLCVLLPVCRLKHVLADAMSAFLAECDRYTLSDLVERDGIMEVLKFS